MYKITFYETGTGKIPSLEFISQLDKKSRAKFARIVELLEHYGPETPMPYSRPLGDGVFEARIITGFNSSRVLYFFFAGKQIVFTNGFKKQTQSTPREEIATAQKYRADFLRRKQNGSI